MNNGLTPKQERFCQEIASGKSQSDAYRASFDAGNMKSATIHKRASELMDNGEVAGRIEELRKPLAEKALLTLEKHLNDLNSLRNGAVQNMQFGAAISAEIARGKAAGLYVVKVDANVKTSELPASVDEFV